MSFHYSEFSGSSLASEIYILGILQVITSLVGIFGYVTLTTLCVVQIMFFEGTAEAFLLYSFLLHIGESILIAILGINAIFMAKYKSLDNKRGWRWNYLAYISMAVAASGIIMILLSGYYLYLLPPVCRILFQICVLSRMERFQAECTKSAMPTYIKPNVGPTWVETSKHEHKPKKEKECPFTSNDI